MKQVESFALKTSSSQILLEAKNSNCLVLAADQELLVYSLKGALLASFRDHAMPISSMCLVGHSVLMEFKFLFFMSGHLKMADMHVF